uniref:Uncharacterized protein n=1 Tax=Arundo donax TaxID=35708 RepID=A0A0A9BQ90_ARUDO
MSCMDHLSLFYVVKWKYFLQW